MSDRPQRLRRTRRFRRRTLRVMVEYTASGGTQVDPATTLGAGGLFIETDRPQPEGTTLKLRFQVPGQDREHEIEGRVVWSARPGDRGSTTPGMGIEFTNKSASAQLARDLDQLE